MEENILDGVPHCYLCKCKINSIIINNENLNIISFSCNHQLCYKCFIQFLIETQFSILSSEIIKKNKIELICKCNKKGKLNISLENLIKILNSYEINNSKDNTEKKNEICSKHNLKYEYFCDNCKLNLCNLCLTNHKENNYNHKIINQFIFDEDKIKCKKHNKNYILFCKKCYNSLCEKCENEEKEKKLEHINEYKYYSKLKEKIIMIQRNLKYKEYKDFLSLLNLKEKEITNKFNDEIYFVKNRIEQLIEYLHQMCSKYISQLYDDIHKFGRIFKIIKLLSLHFYKDLDKSNVYLDSDSIYLSEINSEFTDFKFHFFSCEGLLNSIEEIIYNIESKYNFTIITNSMNENQIKKNKNINDNNLKNNINKECEVTLKGHSWSVLSIIKLNNGNLASSSSDQTIRIWDLEKNNVLSNNYFLRKTIKAHSDSINNILQLKNGNLISCSKDKTIKIFDICNLNEIKELYILKGHNNSVNKIIEIENSKIISCSFDGKLIIWDLNDINNKKIIKAHIKYIYDIIIINKNKIASSSFEEIKIWNIEKLENEFELKGHKGWIYCLCLLKENFMASGSYDKTIIIWNLKEKIQEQIIFGHSQAIQSIISFNNNSFISCSWDKIIKVWKINDNNKFLIYKNLIGHSNEVLCLCYIGNGFIASGSDDTLIKIWNLNEENDINVN